MDLKNQTQRIIKFRVFDTKYNKYVNEVQEKKLWEDDDYLYEYEEVYMPYIDLLGNMPDYNGRLIWEQYTGLKDKNGTEIYEGDVLEWSMTGEKFKVKVDWSEDDCAFLTRDLWRTAGAYLNPEYAENFIVIGNIHQNKELLKQEK